MESNRFLVVLYAESLALDTVHKDPGEHGGMLWRVTGV